MPYTQTTLANILTQLGVLLDDQNSLYWTTTEKTYAVWEALRVWGAYTNYWRASGSFDVGPNDTWYDLSVELPTLRPRVWTLEQLVKDIQYSCLEAANGITGAGMSQQIGITSILQSVKRARNQFVLDVMFPIGVTPLTSVPAGDTGVYFTEEAVALHRVGWQNAQTGVWVNLWREDRWAIDAANPYWLTEQGTPTKYSESELAPLHLQVEPIPFITGAMEALYVPSLDLDLTNGGASLEVPDEWVHAIKWASLADIFSSESQNLDPFRAKYAAERYKQAVDLAKMATSVTRATLNGLPLQIDSMANVDSSLAYWRNQPSRPAMAGVLYDLICPAPIADKTYGLSVDVVRAAPLPTAANDVIQLGFEDVNDITNYAAHILGFKCGGYEFQSTFSMYDGFMKAVGQRNSINRAKIRYMKDLFGMPAKENEQRPNKIE